MFNNNTLECLPINFLTRYDLSKKIFTVLNTKENKSDNYAEHIAHACRERKLLQVYLTCRLVTTNKRTAVWRLRARNTSKGSVQVTSSEQTTSRVTVTVSI